MHAGSNHTTGQYLAETNSSGAGTTAYTGIVSFCSNLAFLKSCFSEKLRQKVEKRLSGRPSLGKCFLVIVLSLYIPRTTTCHFMFALEHAKKPRYLVFRRFENLLIFRKSQIKIGSESYRTTQVWKLLLSDSTNPVYTHDNHLPLHVRSRPRQRTLIFIFFED